MSVVVYPRLAALLEQRHLTVADLGRQIEDRFGLAVDATSFDHLTQTAPVQRADVQIAGATAAVLGVKLDDLFFVATLPSNGANGAPLDVLEAADSKRLRELFDLQLAGSLTDEERAELDALVVTYGRRLHEHNMRELAQQRGVSVEEAEQDTAASLSEALAWWEAFNADPDRERVLTEATAGLQARWPGA